MPGRDKGKVIVFRCDGRFELYWLPINASLDVIPLERGDLIYSWSPPASLVGHQAPPAGTPPEPTPAPSFTPGPPVATSTPWSYPLATPTASPIPTDYP
jgi:hypothetical protein